MRRTVLAGVGVGAAAFAISDVVNSEMSPVAEPISRFVNAGAGWLVPLGMAAVAAAAAALTVMVARGGTSRAGAWLLGGWSLGLLLAACFPADPPGRLDDPSLSDTAHGLAAWLGLLAFTAAAVVLVRAWPRDAVLTGTTVALVSAMILFVISLVEVMAVRALPPLAGLTERVVIAISLGWMALAATRPARTSR